MMQEVDELRGAPEPAELWAQNADTLRREIEVLKLLQHLEAEFLREQMTRQSLNFWRKYEPMHFTGVAVSHDYALYGNKTPIEDDLVDYAGMWSQRRPIVQCIPRNAEAHPQVRSEAHKSDLGNLFYVNDIRDLIAKDFANPEVAPHIQKYPEDIAGGPISGIWQVKDGQWHDIPLDTLTPSILIGFNRYYIHEVAEISDGQRVIPAMWMVSKGKMYADCKLLETNICAHNYVQMQNIPNRFRAIDNGEDLFTVWVPVWADDVSGACSKQYQKHLNVYTANANLPGQLLQQEYFLRFVSTFPHAGALEQLKVVVNQVK
ncbi:hypothetical protein K438DRAFT_1759739 [Mycena galopus ATCC 62051]|nr:hypothetical protein K438DRAFT_1759739 [Mycena galopus ATCC 62051]